MRLLIVEDSEDDAELLCCELAHACEPFVSRRVDCAGAMRMALLDGDWDLIISDHSMPRFSSLEALNVLKESGKDIPFIIYSGTISEHVAVSALNDGVRDFVAKGNVARLIPSIKRELENAANRRAKQRAESHLHQLAYYDELTGLGNRNLFFEEVGRALAARAATDPLAVVSLVNLDRFSRINHVVGFVKAGELLNEVSRRLKRCVGSTGTLARLGDGGESAGAGAGAGAGGGGVQACAERRAGAKAARKTGRGGITVIGETAGQAGVDERRGRGRCAKA